MLVDWRALLGDIRVEWRDRGANCRRGNVNIACPWCGDDPSFHLGISENREAYYCYRDPDKHSGRNYLWLLVKLGVSRYEAGRLLSQHRPYSTEAAPDREDAPRVQTDLGTLGRAWRRFVPAEDSARIMDYLAGRGFGDPSQVAIKHDLRFAPAGAWAQRVLMPFRDLEGRTLGWTGRGLSSRINPRYLTEEDADAGLIYLPRLPDRREGLCMVLVEGPMDALKVSIIAGSQPFLAVAMTGKALIPSRLVRFQALRPFVTDVLAVVDKDVKISTRSNIISILAATMKPRYIGRAILPKGIDDPGELPDNEGSKEWLLKQRERLIKQLPPAA